MVIVGDIFIENYYVVYDFDNQQIGFNGYMTNVNDPPLPDDQSPFPTCLIVFIVVVGFGLILGVVGYIWLRNKRR
jgi:hypothetical protein